MLPHFQVSVAGMKGIYLRDEADFPAAGTLKTTASVKVEFPEETKNPEIVEFEQRLRLKCDAAYVKHAAQILITAGSTFRILWRLFATIVAG